MLVIIEGFGEIARCFGEELFTKEVDNPQRTQMKHIIPMIKGEGTYHPHLSCHSHPCQPDIKDFLSFLEKRLL
ncbi:MAG: hypothetical protein N3D16_07020 [Anaerolineales bacterium]|nr:hypothetical protein [Anaerolineales bacterium]